MVGIRIQRRRYGQRKREMAAPGGLGMFLAGMGAFDRHRGLTGFWIMNWWDPVEVVWWGQFWGFLIFLYKWMLTGGGI